MLEFGVDVSHWNIVNYAGLRSKGVKHLLIKSSSGDYSIDKKFTTHLAGAEAAGLSVIIYHWNDPLVSAVKQVEFLKSVLAPHKNIRAVFIDQEQYWADWAYWNKCRQENRPYDGPLIDPQQISDTGAYLCKSMSSIYSTGVYTNAYFVLDYSPETGEWLSNYINWWAYWPYDRTAHITTWEDFFQYHLPVINDPVFPKVWPYTPQWDVWQITGEKFTLPYCSGKVDVNILKPEFLGGNPPPEPTPVPTSVIVTANTLNVRSGPGTDFPVLTTLTYGKKVIVEQSYTAPNGEVWYEINGWIASWLTKPA
jgi:hypothetical protein